MLSALSGDTVVFAWELDRVARHAMEFCCPTCSEAVVSRMGAFITPHFAHKPGSDCELAIHGNGRSEAEGEVHLRAKYALAKGFAEAGYSVAVEECLGRLRRPDITVVSPSTGQWVTVEIQASPIHPREMRFRWQHDLDAGALDVVWIWAQRKDLSFDGASRNLVLPDDVLNYRRTTGCALATWRRGGLWLACYEPTWWVCTGVHGLGEQAELFLSQRATCPGCGLSRPFDFDDSVSAFSLFPAEPRLVVCRGRGGTPVVRLAATESGTVREPPVVAAL